MPWEKSQDRNRFMFSGDWIGMRIGAPERDGDCRPQQQYRKQKRMPKTVPVFGAKKLYQYLVNSRREEP